MRLSYTQEDELPLPLSIPKKLPYRPGHFITKQLGRVRFRPNRIPALPSPAPSLPINQSFLSITMCAAIGIETEGARLENAVVRAEPHPAPGFENAGSLSGSKLSASF
jgi:hypothetical protein